MDSKDTVIMISTRTPYNRLGISFKFHAAKITTMEQFHEMSIAGMISEGHDIASKLDAIYRETSLPGSQDGLGSSTMLHHECRHMAAHLEATFKKSSQIGDQVDREGTATLDQVDEDTFKLEQNPAEDTSCQPTGYVTKGAGQPDVEGHSVGSAKIIDDIYSYGFTTRENSRCRRRGV